MKTLYAFTVWGSLSFAVAATSCSDKASQQVAATGIVRLSLVGTSASGVTYRLRHAVFEIMGPSPAQLRTEEEPNAETLSKELPAGDYSALLDAGWHLERQTSAGEFESVKAVLVSPNPVSFAVFDQQTTALRFRFKAGDDVLELGDGRVEIGIDIEDAGGVGGGGLGGSGGQGASGGVGGSSGSPCLIDAECTEGTCEGLLAVQACVGERDYCDAMQPCVQRAAGCERHRCLPALALGAACSSAHQCASGYCSGAGVCETGGAIHECCDVFSPNCEEGTVCIQKATLGLCYGQGECMKSSPQYLEPCVPDTLPCAPGLYCPLDAWDMYCRISGGGLGEPCDEGNPCSQALLCDPAAGVCRAKGGYGEDCSVVPCQTGLRCVDEVCRSSGYGEDCSVIPCQTGLRCVNALLNGRCSAAGPG